MTRSTLLLLCVTATLCANVSAAEDEHQHHNMQAPSDIPLTAPGNDAFAAIQEVVEKLRADPDTDWSRVNLEALRQHLVDMENFTLNVEVTVQKPVDNGVEFTVRPTTLGTAGSLERLFKAHPAVLKQESGWDMTAKKNQDGTWTARVTGTKEDTAKIRGLGYIGLAALGAHHQAHHWQMATGADPHKH